MSPGAWLVILGADLGLEMDRTSTESNFPQNLLEQEFGALPLRCKASDGPHFDLNACVELFVPHVPHSLDRRGDCLVLQNRAAASLMWTSCEVCVLRRHDLGALLLLLPWRVKKGGAAGN